MRFILDYASAFVYLLKGEWGNFSAVFHARRDYRKMKKLEKTNREDNLRKTMVEDIPTKSHRFIVLDSLLHK